MELADSKLRDFARTRGIEIPVRGRISKAQTELIKAQFKGEWEAATASVQRRLDRLESERAKATAHLEPYAVQVNKDETAQDTAAE